MTYLADRNTERPNWLNQAFANRPSPSYMLEKDHRVSDGMVSQ